MSKRNEKENIYGPLIRNMPLMCKYYMFMFVPIIIGALGTVPKRLESSLNELGFQKKETKNLIQSVQMRSGSGNIKFAKRF